MNNYKLKMSLEDTMNNYKLKMSVEDTTNNYNVEIYGNFRRVEKKYFKKSLFLKLISLYKCPRNDSSLVLTAATPMCHGTHPTFGVTFALRFANGNADETAREPN